MTMDEHTSAWLKAYCPCENGAHVFDPDDQEFGGRTVRNFPGKDLTVFRELSSAGEGDDYDLTIDLMKGGESVDECFIRRQDLTLIEREIERKIKRKTQ